MGGGRREGRRGRKEGKMEEERERERMEVIHYRKCCPCIYIPCMLVCSLYNIQRMKRK